MVLLLVYLFFLDVDSEHEDHSEVLLLFVGCIVNFIVSFLICMFQDSVPAGSYNDPFLSSVCVTKLRGTELCDKGTRVFVCVCVCVKELCVTKVCVRACENVVHERVACVCVTALCVCV